MSWLEREIRQRFDIAQETLLGGNAPDYPTYVRMDARYQALRELLDAIKDRNDAIAAGEVKVDVDD